MQGIELFSVMPRGTGDLGFYEKPEERIPIRQVRLASYVPPMGPEYFVKFIASETVKWREVVVGANIKAE